MAIAEEGRTAVIVAAEPTEAGLAAVLLEESDLAVVDLTPGGDLMAFLEDHADEVALVFADAGRIRRGQLAAVRTRWPRLPVVVSGGIHDVEIADSRTQRLSKPWRPLELLVAAERARRATG
ncbi:hypothetical protein SD80_027585 [Scytonema tolypothrichoides VB-61278]|jgi:hypothetical protein|nr:hypothetical protein SD80_027585 [Scytonema tolypothrichoides VB-61278]